MSSTEADWSMRKRQLRQMGIDTETGSIELHNRSETARHLVLKSPLGPHLQQHGRP